ncbi:hypothetical protein RSOLAG22IIIB_11471 [Rhizoctonia solani]|uniref:DRBM domain-containing protein n=1 Tax=Rhizoctonia solani TaxID=456999 RepID=A0A0K6G834_9AGAM|nr:hypothetical protein RSOLAG22IIIB_11471 [Rhizoctonia solani]
MSDSAGLPMLPLIQSAPLRKQVFTDISVYRLASDASPQELDRVENTDNNRLSFLGRATLEYALATGSAHSFPDETRKLEHGLAECAHAYDILKLLNVAWRGFPIADKEATRLMEAYTGALVLESERDGIQFAESLVKRIFQLPASNPPPPQSVPAPAPPPPLAPTGLLHNLARQHFLQLVWEDRSTGPKHAQEWISDVTLKDAKSDRIWPCIARGTGLSKKLARADASSKVLAIWDELRGTIGRDELLFPENHV